MRYVRDIPADATDEAREAEEEHVRLHLATIADTDDDPATHIEDVQVWTTRHPDDDGMIRIVGELDADPDAPYLREDFDPWAGVDPELRKRVLGDG